MILCRLLALSTALVLTSLSTLRLHAEDWPTYRHDVSRSGISTEKLPAPLARAWTYRTAFAPLPAFGTGFPHVTNWEGGVEKRRIDFDRADSVVVAGGNVYFGSVGDGRVYCLDPATAKIRWTFPTGGPVRLAPAIHDGRLYVGSDDGWVYCLSAGDGKVVWKFRAAPDDLHVIGHGRLISLWPVRTGVLVDQGVAYFGAGIFPTEGVFLYAVDAASGKLLWKNDQASELRMAQISPQGYMLCTPQQLIVPMSRLAPGVFNRKTGQSEKRLSIYYGGGTFAALNGQCLYTGCEGAQCFPLNAEGERNHGTSPSVANFPGGQLVFAGGRLYSCATPKGPGVSKAVIAFEWNQPDKMPTEEEIRRGQAKPPTPPKELWQCPFETPECIIMAGDLLYVGGPGRVGAITPADGKLVWSHEVDGVALSLAASGGRLFVSTDKGNIECFVPQGTAAAPQNAAPAPNVEVAPQWKQAADAILKQAPQNQKGFALVYGVETGELAIELAKRTDLLIHAVSPDAAKVEAARRRIEAAGLYGGRIVVEQWPLEKVPYTQYFADLVVSETAIATGKPLGTAAEAFRMTKPWHGSVVMGTVKADADAAAPLKQWVEKSPLAEAKIVSDGGTWAVLKRPGLPGAKSWTHQYAVPGATGSSQDDLVRAPLRVQWFGDPGPSEYVDRHYWGAAPLAYEGRMFCCTYNDVSAYDVYTGAKHWTYPLKDAVRAHLADVPSNVAIGPEGYFVAVEDICYRLDPATGKLLGQYKVPEAAPGQRRMWGYVALVDGVLIGSRTLGYMPMEQWRKSRGEKVLWWLLSDLLFAMDAQTGKVLWQYQTPWFRHNGLVASPSKDAQPGVVFITHPGGTPQQQQEALIESKPHIDAYPAKEKARVQEIMKKPYVELLSALDLKTGKPHWQRTVDWTVCGGNNGTLIYQDGLLLMISAVGGCKAFTGYGLEDQLGRSVAVRDAQTGNLVWLKPLNHRSRAVVVGDTIYAEPWMYDLRTGAQKMMKHPTTGQDVPRMFMRAEKHCGPFNASAHTLFFRNGGFGYFDAPRNEGVTRFESNRPNCWLSFISAEGLALWPTSDSGCRCDLAISCSVALVHDEQSRVFGDFACQGELLPIKQLSLNVGGPGDRRDASGQLWLSYPRVKFTSSLELPIKTEFEKTSGVALRSSTWTPIAGTPDPWIYASATVGLKKLQLTLRRPADGAAKYKVALLFAAPPTDKPGSRVFDVKIQGKVVKAGLDVAQESGGTDKALVLTFDNINVTDDLIVELAKKTGDPLLCGLQVTQVP